MRLSLLAASLMLAGVALASTEMTADGMRDAEDLLKSLDSNVSLKLGPKALQEATELARFFRGVEAHYGAQADAQRGLGFAQASRQHAEAAAKALQAGDYDAAFDAVDALQRSCKQCHEVYKKPR